MATNNNEFELYDEEGCVAFVRQQLPQELKDKLTDDDIIYFDDLVFDYFDSRGYLEEEDADSIIEIDEEELLDYICKNVKRDEIGAFSREDLTLILQADLAYMQSLDVFE